MTSFRQKFVVVVIIFIASALAVGQLSWADTGGILSLFWSILTMKTILPITLGIMLILGLLLWWNPDDGR